MRETGKLKGTQAESDAREGLRARGPSKLRAKGQRAHAHPWALEGGVTMAHAALHVQPISASGHAAEPVRGVNYRAL